VSDSMATPECGTRFTGYPPRTWCGRIPLIRMELGPTPEVTCPECLATIHAEMRGALDAIDAQARAKGEGEAR
jgi:hypothetical protein